MRLFIILSIFSSCLPFREKSTACSIGKDTLTIALNSICSRNLIDFSTRDTIYYQYTGKEEELHAVEQVKVDEINTIFLKSKGAISNLITFKETFFIEKSQLLTLPFNFVAHGITYFGDVKFQCQDGKYLFHSISYIKGIE